MKRTSWIIVLILLGISCLDQPDCYNLTNSTVTIAFKKIFDDKADTVYVDFAKVQGLDSVFYPQQKATSLRFPVNYKTNVTLINIFDPERTRQLELTYFVQPQFISEECGPGFLISNITSGKLTTDSSKVLSSSLDGVSANINLYRCPRTHVLQLAFSEPITIINTTADYEAVSLYPITGLLSSIKLPLNLNANSTTFFFQFQDVTKTLTLVYDRVEETKYGICGKQVFIRNLKVKNTDFALVSSVDDTLLKRDSIYDPPIINFKIEK